MKKTVAELFAGVGGFRVGLNRIDGFDETGRAVENNDYEFVWANQWEPSTKTQPAYDCYCTRFGTDNHSNVDISKVDKAAIPDHALLVGGFPCQDYSVAHSLAKEKGIEGKKGVLFWDIADILKAKQPPFVLLENVDRLLKSPAKQRGRDFGIMLRTFYDNGYNVEWRVINAAEYGARQRRRRIFIFAWLRTSNYNTTLTATTASSVVLNDGVFARSFPVVENTEGSPSITNLKNYADSVQVSDEFKFEFNNAGCMVNGEVITYKVEPNTDRHPIPLRDTLQHNVDEKYFLNDNQKEKFAYLRGSKKIERTKPNGEKYFYSEGGMSEYDLPELPSRTMLTSEGTVNRSTHIVKDLDNGRLRFLTPVETERLQHFPDNWTDTGMTDKQRNFMMGNALVTDVIRTLEPVISDIIENE